MSTVIILHPSAVYRAGLASLLGTTSFSAVQEVASVDELNGLNSKIADPLLILIAPLRADQDVVNSVQQVRARLPDTKIVILATTFDVSLLCECFANGISGFVLEDISPTALEESLKLVSLGEKIFPSELAHLMSDLATRPTQSQKPADFLENMSDFRFSPRDVEILLNLADGKSNKEIARTLGLAASTVKLHIKRILQNIDVSNRTQAALWVARRKFAAAASGRGGTTISGKPPAATFEPQNGSPIHRAVLAGALTKIKSD